MCMTYQVSKSQTQQSYTLYRDGYQLEYFQATDDDDARAQARSTWKSDAGRYELLQGGEYIDSFIIEAE